MSHQIKRDSLRLRKAWLQVLLFIAVLWAVKLFELLSGTSFGTLGVRPLHASGLIGILCAPLIHVSIPHLIANTGGLLFLGTTLLYGYPKSAKILFPVLYIGCGIGVWFFARDAYHQGASGLTFGFMFFIFTIGALRWDKQAIALSMSVFFLYGGMLGSLLPDDTSISYETHLFGAGIGILLAFLLKNIDPPPPAKKYSWEGKDDEYDEWDEGFESGSEELQKPDEEHNTTRLH